MNITSIKKSIFTLLCIMLFATHAEANTYDWFAVHEAAAQHIIHSGTLDDPHEEIINDPIARALFHLYYYESEIAEAMFKAILLKDPTNVTARWGIADLEKRYHNPAESEVFLRTIIDEYPAFAPAYVSLGYCLYFQDKYEEGQEIGELIVQANFPVDTLSLSDAHLLLSACKGTLVLQKPLSKQMFLGPMIMIHINKALKLMPGTPAPLFTKGTSYLKAPNLFICAYDKAERYLLEAQKKRPLFASVYVRLAEVYEALEQFEQRDANLELATSIDPQNNLLLSYWAKRKQTENPDALTEEDLLLLKRP